MIKKSITVLLISLVFMSMTSDKPAYLYKTNKGKIVDFNTVVEAASKADIVFFGELHNNAIAHWMELEMVKSLYQKEGKNLIIGAEMYESDQQLIVDEYLSNEVDYSVFKEQARLWKNDETDYHPILEFARENKLKFVATNVPRRYAAAVNHKGFEILDSLSEQAKAYMSPLPIQYDSNLTCYKNMLTMMGGHSGAMKNMPKAQALKDATMASFILKNWSTNKCFFHFNGSYHSDNYQGIVWYLKQQNPNLKIVTISTVEQSDINKNDEESLKKGDFILVVDQNLTKTY